MFFNDFDEEEKILKRTNLLRTIRSGVFALSFIALVASVSASAQNNNNNNSVSTANTNTRVVDRDDDMDWGWLGLAGLAGLAGLLKRPQRDVTVQRDVDPGTTRRP